MENTKKMKKLLKKTRKEEKKTRALVKEAFNAEKTKGKKNPMVESIVKSVMINKAVLKRDKDKLLEWQNSYYQDLFSEFKKLVDDHNKIFQVKGDELINKINMKQSELKRLKAEIKQLEAEKELKNA